MNPQTSLMTCLAWLILIAKNKNRLDSALDWNKGQFSIRTAMYSCSEHNKTRRVLSYPSKAISKYSQIVMVHHAA